MMPLHVHNQHVAADVKRELDELVTDTGNWEDEIDAGLAKPHPVWSHTLTNTRAAKARIRGGR